MAAPLTNLHPFLQPMYDDILARLGQGQTGDTTFLADFIVSLSNGKTFGRYLNGQTVPAAGKTAVDVIMDAAIEAIFPTYTVASLGLNVNVPLIGEVGETISPVFTANFIKNDAGNLTEIHLNKNNSLFYSNGTVNPLTKNDSILRSLNGVSYQALASYLAGNKKNITPNNIPDTRSPQIRNTNAPQASETNFPSNIISIYGKQAIFYGPSNTTPSNPIQVRALSGKRLTSDGNIFILNTGNTLTNFSFFIPDGLILQSVIDLDSLNANLTNSYSSINFTNMDANNSPVSGKLYTLKTAVAYSENKRHQITLTSV